MHFGILFYLTELYTSGMVPRRNALFLYNDASGKGKVNRHLDEVLAALSSVYQQVDSHLTASIEEAMERARQSCGVYDALIFSGGDGTFSHIVSALVGRKDAPIIGYINGGTLCDVGKNFGIHGSFRRALKIIADGYTCGFDVGKINEDYFTYVAAIGAFADIPYVTPRKYKKRLGYISYYFEAVKEAFVPRAIPCRIIADGVHYELKTPFILCMSGKNVGGFPINSKKSSIHDGRFELYLTKPGLFNGLVHYFLFKMRTKKIVAADIYIEVDHPLPWDLDGEVGPRGNVHITAMDSGLRIFCAKKCAE